MAFACATIWKMKGEDTYVIHPLILVGPGGGTIYYIYI